MWSVVSLLLRDSPNVEKCGSRAIHFSVYKCSLRRESRRLHKHLHSLPTLNKKFYDLTAKETKLARGVNPWRVGTVGWVATPRFWAEVVGGSQGVMGERGRVVKYYSISSGRGNMFKNGEFEEK